MKIDITEDLKLTPEELSNIYEYGEMVDEIRKSLETNLSNISHSIIKDEINQQIFLNILQTKNGKLLKEHVESGNDYTILISKIEGFRTIIDVKIN